MLRKSFYAVVGMILTIHMANAHTQNSAYPEICSYEVIGDDWKLVSTTNEMEVYYSVFEFEGSTYLKIKVKNISSTKTGQVLRLYQNHELVIFSDDGAEGMYIELEAGMEEILGERVLVPFAMGDSFEDYELTIKSN